MSKYTTELRYICESYAGISGVGDYGDIDNVISKSRPKIFDFTYPIPLAHKEELETKILMHYYTREIAHETVGRWRLALRSKMLDIMPYYNQLYDSVDNHIYNPLEDVDVTRTKNTESEGETSGVGRSLYSDTPQGGLEGLESERYLTNAQKTTSENDATSTEDMIEHIKGKHGAQSYASMIRDYRKNILNIELKIIGELEELFFSLY